MSDVLESLVPEVYDCLSSGLNLEALLAMRTVSNVWQERIGKASSAWKSCCEARFSDLPSCDAHCMEAFKQLRKAEKQTMSIWRRATLEPEAMFVFSSYVRCWASDDLLLVAGLYDGTIQPVDWETRSAKGRFQGRHGDEVICIDLNKEFILSGSGDPGYYQRSTADASVKLWRRPEGKLLGSLAHHSNSVRGVVLLPSTSKLCGLALSASLDRSVVLMSTDPFQSITTQHLPGECRSLCLVTPKCRPLLGSEARVLASAGVWVVELAVRKSVSEPQPSLVALRQINVQLESISGLSCYLCPSLWERVPVGLEYPAVLLDEDGVLVAGGTVSAGLWMYGGNDPAGRLRHLRLSNSRGSLEVVSVELLNSKMMLAVCRTGNIILAEATSDCNMIIRWAMQGFRMYVSTIGRREPLLLISDGFDNAIRTIRAVWDGDEQDDED